LSGFVVVAAFAQLIVLELEEETGDLVMEIARVERPWIRTRLGI